MGEWTYITIHFKLDTTEVTDQLHNPATTHLGPKLLILMNRRLGEYESVWTLWRKEKSLSTARNLTMIHNKPIA